MPSVAEVSAAYSARQRDIAQRASRVSRILWGRVDPDAIRTTWSPQLRTMVAAVRTSQQAAATGSTQIVRSMLAAQGIPSSPDGSVVASMFAQSAASGEALGSLLYVPVLRAQQQVAQGTSPADAWSQAADQLAMMVVTEVADAGRLSMSAAMLSNRRCTGYYRNPGASACDRCAILAGLWSKTFEGAAFERHPRCQCTAVPAGDESGSARGVAPSARSYFDSLGPSRQDAVFGKANAEAIRAGADPAAVVNARRGMAGPGEWTTTEGTSRRGVYGGYTRAADGSLVPRAAGEKVPPRLTPAAIVRLSATRDEAVQMLTDYGYIV